RAPGLQGRCGPPWPRNMSHSSGRFNWRMPGASVTNVPLTAAAGRVHTCPKMAWALQNSPSMITDTRCWRRLTPETITELPETAAVFEVANLVRTVQFIGRASGNLRARMATYMSEDLKLRPCTGGYFFRYEPTASAARRLPGGTGRLAGPAESHAGERSKDDAAAEARYRGARTSSGAGRACSAGTRLPARRAAPTPRALRSLPETRLGSESESE